MAWRVDVCPALAPAAEGLIQKETEKSVFEGVNRTMLEADHHDPKPRHGLIDLALLP